MNEELKEIVRDKLVTLKGKTLLLAFDDSKTDWWMLDDSADSVYKKLKKLGGLPATKYKGIMCIPANTMQNILETIMLTDLGEKTFNTSFLEVLTEINRN